MKKTYTLILAAFLTISSFAQIVNYQGNKNSGAGGAVGNGSLDLSNDATYLNVTFNRGTTGDFNDVLVIYIQSGGSGFTSTAGFTDARNNLTKAISGYDGTNRSVFTFTDKKFKPAVAIAIQPGAFQPRTAIEVLKDGVDFTDVTPAPSISNGTVTNAATYSFQVKLNKLGIDPVLGFKFIATYVSPTGGRSDEAIGDPMTGFTAGWNDYTSTSEPEFYNEALLPAIFGNFTGSFVGKNVQLNWNTTTEINTRQFDVQKSGDGAAWKSIGTIATQNSSTGAHYSYLDNNVSDAVTYYKIRLTDNDAAVSYSPVIIMRKDGIAGITLLGNPAKGVVNLNISNSNAGKYNIELYSVDGRKIASQVYNHPGGSGKVSIAVPGSVKGTCIVRISNGTANQSMKVVVE